MLDVIKDTLIDSLKLLPFLFLAFLAIEFIEHKCGDKTKEFISNSGKMGPLLGGILGAIPQCGFSVFATNLYITKLITFGTLISIYLSTSDEMIAVFVSNQLPIKTILLVVCLKVIIGILCGFIIDLLYKRNSTKMVDMCEDCGCEESLIKGVLNHTFKTFIFILIITFILNILFYMLDDSIINNIFMKNSLVSIFVSALIGLIPNCSASIIISELYVNKVISFGSLMAGLLSNSGTALLVLFKNNKQIKENMIILAILYFISCLIGVILFMCGVTL